ncbi:MAG: D-aminoacyl-tRNA deacylase [Acidimicrobiia bacterium]|nr:D-aminoacyl-tRNA deacylase [Acidimicrobiia bacterium]
MRVVVQRVRSGRVDVDESTVGEIGLGLVVLVGVEVDDVAADAVVCASKIAGLRIFRDDEDKMNRSVEEVGGAVLVVSQFTLAGDVRKGRRPSFVTAARPEAAQPLVQRFCTELESRGLNVETGVFGAMMEVSLVNDGPVTIIVESRDGKIL